MPPAKDGIPDQRRRAAFIVELLHHQLSRMPRVDEVQAWARKNSIVTSPEIIGEMVPALARATAVGNNVITLRQVLMTLALDDRTCTSVEAIAKRIARGARPREQEIEAVLGIKTETKAPAVAVTEKRKSTPREQLEHAITKGIGGRLTGGYDSFLLHSITNTPTRNPTILKWRAEVANDASLRARIEKVLSKRPERKAAGGAFRPHGRLEQYAFTATQVRNSGRTSPRIGRAPVRPRARRATH